MKKIKLFEEFIEEFDIEESMEFSRRKRKNLGGGMSYVGKFYINEDDLMNYTSNKD